MLSHDLLTGWTLRAVGDTDGVPPVIAGLDIPATVPGCVHTDLLAADLIPDPYLDRNEALVQWIGRTDWQYTCRFELPAAMLAQSHLTLACDGLDTLARVELNGRVIGRSANMHQRQRFDAKVVSRVGVNTLRITFSAALPHAEAERDRLGTLPAHGSGSNPIMPHNFIRKMACNFGWDWGPVLITAGVWRPIRFEAYQTARLTDVRPTTTALSDQKATLQVAVGHERCDDSAPAEVRLHLTGHGSDVQQTVALPEAGRPLVAELPVENPQAWWPIGHGAQPLYDLTVTLVDAAGDELDRREHRIGLRTTELVTDRDPQAVDEPVTGLGQGAGMFLRVNGRRIFCKGANWIPDDCFLHRVTPERYRQRITQAADANMNMLRIWGGGVFEAQVFYEICDELGVMVWQDFLCACAAYSEEEPLRSLIAAEARDNVSRLARHPSLVLFNGCNENLWGYEAWEFLGQTWPQIIGDRGWGLHYYFEVFPEVIAELAPGIPYWPASPSSGSLDRPANDNRFGNRHVWDVWHGPGQYRNYLAHFPRFASEFGFHGPPNWPNIAASVPPDQWSWNSEVMNLHNKNSSNKPGQLQTHTRMGDDFVPPENFDDWLYLAQIMQARALELGVTWFRALSPWCSGALYWQLNDCWPVSSWSAIDSDGKCKPLWYASRRFFAPRLLTIKPRQITPVGEPLGKLAVYAHNDSLQPWAGRARLQLMSLDGQVQDETTWSLDVPANESSHFPLPEAWNTSDGSRFVVAQAPEAEVARAFWWFAPDKAMDYPEPRFEATVERSGSAHRLTIKAQSLLRDLCVFADRLDPQAVVSDQALTLLPGDTVTLTITSDQTLNVEALTQPPVLQTANRFGRQPAMV